MNIPRWFANTLKGCGCLLVLLVIVAIISPVVIKARETNYHKSCASNEKIVGLALMQYVQDNDECLPNVTAASGSPVTWQNLILPYLRDSWRFQCPDREDDKTLGPDRFPRSYAANYSGDYSGGSLDRGQGVFAGPGAKLIGVAELNTPATLITLCEVEGSNAPEFNIDDAGSFGPDTHTLWAGHKNRSNFLFADGHVKSLLPTQTASYSATDGSRFNGNIWYRDGTKPLSPTSVAILAEAEKRGADRP